MWYKNFNMKNPKLTIFVLTLLFFSLGMGVQAQDCLNSKLEKTSPDQARYHRRLVRVNDTLFVAEVFDLEQRLRFTGNYLFSKGKLLEHGEFVFFFPNGTIESKGLYDQGIKIGTWQRFAENGAKRPDKYYNPARTEELRSVMESK